MPLSHSKLGTKLGAAFFTVVLLTALLGGFALQQMGRIYAHTEDIANNWLASVQVLGHISNTLNTIRRGESDRLTSLDDKEIDEVDKRIASAQKTLEHQLGVYMPLIATPEERRVADQFRQELDQYFATQPELARLSRGGEAAFAKTKTYFRGASQSTFRAAEMRLARLVEINDKGAEQAYASAGSAYNNALGWVIALLAATCVAAVLLAAAIVRSVTRQLGGEPSTAADLARSVAAGDLSARIALRDGDNYSMLAQLKYMQDSLSHVVSQVRDNAEGVATASAQIAQGNADLSQRTEEQASALEQTAASMEQLNSTVRQNADNARQAQQLALGASTVAVRSGSVVNEVVATMRGINESSRKISDIIAVVDGIAFQTNILALNAAVEAARAGEQGRGFAVVASEVRSLAQRSADAAKQVKHLITSNVEQVEQSTALADRAGTTMKEVVGSIQRVTDIMGEISAASTEQSQGVAQVGEAISQMDQVTQQNAALVEESAAAAASLRQQAQRMVDMVAVFKLQLKNSTVHDVSALPSRH